MASLLLGLPLAIAALLPQQVPAPKTQKPAPAARPAPPKQSTPVRSPGGAATQKPASSSIQGIQFDESGYPIVPDDVLPPPSPALPAPAGETAAPRKGLDREDRPSTTAGSERTEPKVPPRRAGNESRADIASGMQLGSALLDIYQSTRSPGAFRELGGVVVSWRLTTYGLRGEVLGTRDVTQIADCAFAERDRLDYADGRVCGRLGAQVYVERQGMPAPTLMEAAQQELVLFGTQLRMPWLFADTRAFTVTARDVDERDGERLARVVIERRPPPSLDLLGPDPQPVVRDRYEICFEPSSGQPREFVHRLAASKQTRRIVLEDWRDFEGVRMPYRRAYVDESMRVTTMLEIKSIERQRVTERDFRLH